MVTLPTQFVSLKFPGYFWNTVDKKLYSIKVTGELRPLQFFKGGTFFGKTVPPGYRISHHGVRRTIPIAFLNTLKPTIENQVIPISTT